MTELRTERLALRDWRPEDREPFAALNDDPAVMEHFPSHLSREQSDAMADRITAFLGEHGWGLWAVEVARTGEFIGFTGLSVPRFEAHFTPCVEVGWRLARSAWGQGYATEAARASVAHGFGVLDLDEIVAMVVPANTRSQGVMRKLGMTRDEGRRLRPPDDPRGQPGPTALAVPARQGLLAVDAPRSRRAARRRRTWSGGVALITPRLEC